jgi:hypothetical protein
LDAAGAAAWAKASLGQSAKVARAANIPPAIPTATADRFSNRAQSITVILNDDE